jgi:HTH-type transcriptional regulator/antitoxin HigA
MIKQLKPARVPPPGTILSEEIEARGWTQKDLAEIIDRPAQAINEIVKGTKQITPETAIELSAAFGTSAQFWTNLEANYRLHLAQKETAEQEISRKSKLYSITPVSEIIRRGWIQASDSIEELEKNVCQFLGITSPNETPKLAANLRCNPDQESEVNARIAWAKRVENISKMQKVSKFDHDKLQSAIPTLLSYAEREEDISKVPDLLLSLGIHFVIVPHLNKTHLDGAAFYVDDHPVIALTLRHDRIDWFWFTLMHELAHIILKHEGFYLDNLDEGDINPQEQEANQKARDWILEPTAFNIFFQKTKPYFSKSAIAQFAASQNRHVGIVLGRIHHETKDYTKLRSLLVKVSPFLKNWIDAPTKL